VVNAYPVKTELNLQAQSLSGLAIGNLLFVVHRNHVVYVGKYVGIFTGKTRKVSEFAF
jgi:hypothetical protein